HRGAAPRSPLPAPRLPARYRGLRPLRSPPTRRSSDLAAPGAQRGVDQLDAVLLQQLLRAFFGRQPPQKGALLVADLDDVGLAQADRKSTRLNSSHVSVSYAVFCLKQNGLRRRSVDGGV